MHPPLDRPHPECQNVIENLTNCHDDNPFAKFVGACNGAKAALDKCFSYEKEHRRSENLRQSKKWRESYEAKRDARRKKEQEQ